MAALARGPASPLILVGCGDARIAVDLAEMLESCRFRVEVAEKGSTALLRLKETDPPAIALLDMDLPSPSGVEIMWELARSQEQRRGWLVLMSARTGKECVRAALESGCDDFLAIPANAMEGKARLRGAERVQGLMSQVRKQSAELEYHATHDGLTGLWNREALLSLAFQETDRVQRMKTELCLMVLDLDEFSRINSEYGYEAGDRVLNGLANRIRRQLRSSDLIGRYGEDELVLALPACRR